MNDAWRERIQTSMLLNRLQDYILADLSALNGDDADAKKAARRAMMTDGQVKAALGVLKKTLPDLAQSDVNVTQRQTLDDVIRESYRYDEEFEDLSADPPNEVHH